MILYVNGEVIGQTSSTRSIDQLPDPATIGYWDSWTDWYGTIDEVAVYGRAISESTAREHCRAADGAGVSC